MASNSDATHNERTIAQKALIEFTAGQYSQCSKTLGTLEALRPNDIKVLYNKAVCEYYKSGLTQSETFRDFLEQSAKSNEPGQDWAGKGEILQINLAVIYFHEKKLKDAVRILEILFDSIDSLEEKVGINVGLLLTHCYLACDRPDSALTVLTHLENSFLPRHSSPPQSSPPSPTKHLQDSASGSQPLPLQIISHDEGQLSGSCHDSLRRSVLLLKARAFILLRMLKPANKEFKTVVQEAAIANQQLELNLVSMKSQLKFMKGKFFKSLKVLNNCASINSTSLSGNLIIRQEWPSLDVWYNNNLALIHSGMNKPVLALMYIQQALALFNSDTKLKKKSSVCLYDQGNAVSSALLYNTAVMCLRHGNSEEVILRAFKLFEETLKAYPNNPRIWLHLAQCAVSLHKLKLQRSQTNIQARTLGRGVHTKLLIEMSSDRMSPEKGSLSEPNLHYARVCVQNALRLLPAATASFDDVETLVSELHSMSPSLPVRMDELLRLKCAALAVAAYISLTLQDYRSAFNYSRSLLQLVATMSSPQQATYKFLASLYCSEALVLQNKLEEALEYIDVAELQLPQEHLSTASIKDENIYMKGGVAPESTIDQRFIMHFNLSLVYALRGDYQRAMLFITKITTGRRAPHEVVVLELYLNLKLGLVQKAKEVIAAHLYC